MTEGQSPNRYLAFADFELDIGGKRLLKTGQDIALRPKAMDLLLLLAQHAGQLVSRDDIMRQVWQRSVVTSDSITQCIIEIRRALGDTQHQIIKTVPKRGYILTATVATTTRRCPIDAATVSEPYNPKLKRTRHKSSIHWAGLAISGSALLFTALNHLYPQETGITESAMPSVVADTSTAVLPFTNIDPSNKHDQSVPYGSQTWKAGAYEAYLKGRFYLSRRHPGDARKARRAFEAALTKDPNQADAWAGLASALRHLAGNAVLPRASGLEALRKASQRALALNPAHVEAHVRLSNYWYSMGEVERANALLQEARDTNPNDVLLLSVLAGNAVFDGDIETGLELQQRALALDPLSTALRHNLAAYYFHAGFFDSAREQYLELMEIRPGHQPVIDLELSRIALLQGNPSRALQLTEGITNDSARAIRAMALWARGESGAAEHELHKIIEDLNDSPDEMITVTEILAQRQDTEAALEWMNRILSLVENGDYPFDLVCTLVFQARYSPFLEPLQQVSGWNELLEQLAMLGETQRQRQRVSQLNTH